MPEQDEHAIELVVRTSKLTSQILLSLLKKAQERMVHTVQQPFKDRKYLRQQQRIQEKLALTTGKQSLEELNMHGK